MGEVAQKAEERCSCCGHLAQRAERCSTCGREYICGEAGEPCEKCGDKVLARYCEGSYERKMIEAATIRSTPYGGTWVELSTGLHIDYPDVGDDAP